MTPERLLNISIKFYTPPPKKKKNSGYAPGRVSSMEQIEQFCVVPPDFQSPLYLQTLKLSKSVSFISGVHLSIISQLNCYQQRSQAYMNQTVFANESLHFDVLHGVRVRLCSKLPLFSQCVEMCVCLSVRRC